MLLLRLNAVTREWFDEDGNLFADTYPRIPYGNRERVVIQLYSETPAAGTPGVDIEGSWIKYTRFGDAGFGALLSSDNNFQHLYKQTLAAGLSAGAAAEISVNLTATAENVPDNGVLTLYAADGTAETFAFVSRRSVNNTYAFILADGSEAVKSYLAGDRVDVPEALYFQAPLVAEDSDPAAGLFAFDLVCDSPKLRNSMEYSDASTAPDVKGLELLVFETLADDSVADRGRFLCDTFSIPGGIADLTQTGDPPAVVQNQTLVLINSLLSRGMEVQLSADAETWTDYSGVDIPIGMRFFRFRLKTSGGDWSPPVPLLAGPQGEPGPVGAQGGSGLILPFTPVMLDEDEDSSSYWLYSVTPQITASGWMNGFTWLRTAVTTSDPAATGDVVLEILARGITVKTLTVPVTAEIQPLEIRFDAPVSGKLTLRRNPDDVRDTLDGSVAAVLYEIEAWR